MAQLAGIVMIDPEKSEQQENFFFGGIENCKFRKPVVPGDQLVSLQLKPQAVTSTAGVALLIAFAGVSAPGLDHIHQSYSIALLFMS